MRTVRDIERLNEVLEDYSLEKRSVGFVPTMGYLHDGHLSLVRRAREENERVILSIYVNPAQFSPQEDLDTYPRNFQRDLELAEEAGVDLVFAPDDAVMYPTGFDTWIHVGGVTENLCGASRPGHFRGVATVVARLFHLVKPDRAYFGQKDAQQAAVIRKMVRDLGFTVDVVVCPIVREPDGLAMSSRNAKLSPEERKQARVLSQALWQARELYRGGERSAPRILEAVQALFDTQPLIRLDYLKIVDPLTMEDLEDITGEALAAVAAFAGNTRLIDNLKLEEENHDA